MKSREEIKAWIVENCVNKFGEVILNDLDFTGRSVNISYMKARRIVQNGHIAERIIQSLHKATYINNSFQTARVIDNSEQTILEKVTLHVTKEQKEKIMKIMEEKE